MCKLKTAFLFILLFSGNVIFAQDRDEESSEGNEDEFHHCFFSHNSVTLGLGTTYSIPHEQAGISGRVYFNTHEKWCIGPEFSYIRKGDKNLADLNLVVHYIFETPLLGIYPVVGANYSYEAEHEHSESSFGMVYGGGVHRNFKKVSIFSEYTRVQGKISDQFISAGMIFTFKL